MRCTELAGLNLGLISLLCGCTPVSDVIPLDRVQSASLLATLNCNEWFSRIYLGSDLHFSDCYESRDELRAAKLEAIRIGAEVLDVSAAVEKGERLANDQIQSALLDWMAKQQAQSSIAKRVPPTLRNDEEAQARAIPHFDPLIDPNNRITLGRCHMGECSWAMWIDSSPVRISGEEETHEFLILGGTSKHAPEEEYPDSEDQAQIEWNSDPHVVNVTCSLTNPMVSFGADALQVPAYDSDAAPAYLEASMSFYWTACHSNKPQGEAPN